MKTSTIKKNLLLALIALGISAPQAYALAIPSAGTLNVTILDENGSVVSHAPVYIYGEAKTKFLGGKEIPGTATLNMPAGTYRVSCAIMRKTGEYYDRFASRVAHVEVVAGDNTVVTLRLYALENPALIAGDGDVSSTLSDGSQQIARAF